MRLLFRQYQVKDQLKLDLDNYKIKIIYASISNSKRRFCKNSDCYSC